MSMTPYKGFLINLKQWYVEGRDYDGHSSERNGIFTEHFGYEAVEAITGKSTGPCFDSSAEAMSFVDAEVSGENTQLRYNIAADIAQLSTVKETLTREFKAVQKVYDSNVAEITAATSELYGKTPQELT